MQASELKAALKASKIPLNTDKEIDRIIKDIDYFGNGCINYSEFLAATMDVTAHMSNQ